jgi:uncharacterized protein (DUF488 family)
MSESILTVGHSTLPFAEFAGLLRGAGVTAIVDVRRLPGSARYPWFDEDELQAELPEQGITYRRVAELGGRRGRQREIDPEINAFWRNRSFHNYADYALTAPFEQGLDDLISLARHDRVAVMCAEAVWWRCHRRIIADHLLARGVQVRHLMPDGRLVAAELPPGAVTLTAADGIAQVSYPAPPAAS